MPSSGQASQLGSMGISALSLLAFQQIFPLVKGVDLVVATPTLGSLNQRLADQGATRVDWLKGVNVRIFPLAFGKQGYVEGDLTWLYGFSRSPTIQETDEIATVSPQLTFFRRLPIYAQEDFLLEEFSYVYMDWGFSLGIDYVGHEIITQSSGEIHRAMRSATALSWGAVLRFSTVDMPFLPAVLELKYRLTTLGDFVDQFGNSIPGSATPFRGLQISLGQNLY